jgi:hypothetical protein
MGEDGILRTTVKPFSEITIAHARENTEFVLKLKDKETVPILVDLRNIKSISKEARAHFSMKGRKGAVNAMALIIKSPVSKVIGNFFILLDKPLVPTRLFTNESEALTWLKVFVTQ